MSDKALSQMIGEFVQHHRLNQNKTQTEVSKAAGISRSTLSLIERGEKVKLNSLLQVMRILDVLYVLETFIIKEDISPLAYAKLKKKARQKASGKSEASNDNEELGW